MKNYQGNPTDRTEPMDPLTDCVDRWKAVADDSKKGMFDCFEEAGIFVAVCSHGVLIMYCDMIRSGEL